MGVADDKLNVVYNKLYKEQDAVGKLKLKASQQAWLKYRDTNAEFHGDLERGGSMESLLILSFETKMTKARTKELQESLKATGK